MRVAVVMPVAEDSPSYRRAIAALRAAAPPPDETVVVCDGPAPGAAGVARAAGFLVVERDVAGGPAVARNAGARATDADVLLFVDADVAVHPDLIARARAALAADDVAAVVGCYDDAPPEKNFFSQYKHLLQRYVHLDAKREGSTFWGACGAIRRRVFVEMRGFDERYRRPSVEDIELGYRLKAAGHRIQFRPELEVTHLKRWTFVSLLKSDVLRRALPWTWLLLREARVERDLNLRYRSRLAGVLACALALSLVLAFFDQRTLVVAAGCGVALVTIDWRLAAFFAARGGAWFAARAIAWHWFYYVYSTLTFVAGVVTYPIVGRRRVMLTGE